MRKFYGRQPSQQSEGDDEHQSPVTLAPEQTGEESTDLLLDEEGIPILNDIYLRERDDPPSAEPTEITHNRPSREDEVETAAVETPDIEQLEQLLRKELGDELKLQVSLAANKAIHKLTSDLEKRLRNTLEKRLHDQIDEMIDRAVEKALKRY